MHLATNFVRNLFFVLLTVLVGWIGGAFSPELSVWAAIVIIVIAAAVSTIVEMIMIGLFRA